MSVSDGQSPSDDRIEHDRLAEEADLLTTLEANARVRELLRETHREIAELTSAGAAESQLVGPREKLAQLEAALKRYPDRRPEQPPSE
jgi:hypothetical protein